jgi:error-prone DNA polymerase
VVGVVVEKAERELFTAFVMNREGYSRICRVLTCLLTDTAGTYDPVAALAESGWGGLSVLSQHRDVIERLAAVQTRGLYVQLAYGRPFSALAGYARERGVAVAASMDTVFLDESDERLYPMLRAIDLNTTLERVPPSEMLQERNRFVPPQAVAAFFSAVPEALSNAEEIARQADASGIISPHYIFPAFEGLSEEETFRMLLRLCEQGVQRRYGGMRPDIRQRLDYELAIIREKGFASYFLVLRAMDVLAEL